MNKKFKHVQQQQITSKQKSVFLSFFIQVHTVLNSTVCCRKHRETEEKKRRLYIRLVCLNDEFKIKSPFFLATSCYDLRHEKNFTETYRVWGVCFL